LFDAPTSSPYWHKFFDSGARGFVYVVAATKAAIQTNNRTKKKYQILDILAGGGSFLHSKSHLRMKRPRRASHTPCFKSSNGEL